MKVKENVVSGWKSTLVGLLLIAISCGYYFTSRESDIVTVLISGSGVAFGFWMIINPDTAIPFFVSTITSLLSTITSGALARLKGIFGSKK